LVKSFSPLKKPTASARLSGGEPQVTAVDIRVMAAAYGGKQLFRFIFTAFWACYRFITGTYPAQYFKPGTAARTLIFI
jgi:hypothetical protein